MGKSGDWLSDICMGNSGDLLSDICVGNSGDWLSDTCMGNSGDARRVRGHNGRRWGGGGSRGGAGCVMGKGFGVRSARLRAGRVSGAERCGSTWNACVARPVLHIWVRDNILVRTMVSRWC